MAAPTYTTDLADITLNEALGTWVETGTWTTGAAPALEPDVFIQGSNSIAKYWTTGGGGGTASGAIFDAGSALTIPSPGAFFIWIFLQCPNNIATDTNGGLRVIMGDSSTAFNGWTVGGSDTLPIGGWVCFPVDPAVARQFVVGAPTEDSTRQWFGFGFLQTATAKGGVASDALRYGRGRLSIEFGSVADGLATFFGAGTYDSNTTRRWGLLTPIDAGYLMQGLFQMGTSTNAVDFRDSNVTVLIPNTRRVISSFNAIEIRNASSRVDWTNISVRALGTTSPCSFDVIDNADVNFSLCQFTGMGAFNLLSATDIFNSVWRSCGQITAPGSNLSGSEVRLYTGAADTSALVWNVATDPDGKLDNMTFEKGTNAHHAIQYGTSAPLTTTLRGITFTGFNASNGQNDSVLYLSDRGSDVTWTINTVGCSGTVSYKKARTGDTVVIVADPVTLSIHVQDINTTASISGATVWIPVTSSAGGRPYNASVTITRSVTTATVSHTSHGLATNDKIHIAGANEWQYNGTFSITKIDDNSYSYTVVDSPATPATGTITATFVVISTTTDGSGNASASYTYTADQTIGGRVRKSTGATLYKTSPISGTIDSTSGLSITVQMIPDS